MRIIIDGLEYISEWLEILDGCKGSKVIDMDAGNPAIERDVEEVIIKTKKKETMEAGQE